MTRANLNFVSQKRGERPKTLYHYYNGDQYPTGLRDSFGVVEWLKDEKAFTPNGFKKWIAKNYKEQVMKTSGPISYCDDSEKDGQVMEITHPAIYYDTGGFITDYSYVFDSTNERKAVVVYNWDEQIFKGTVKEFIKWLKKQE